MTLRFNLGSYLERHGITAYRVVKESNLAPNTVYTLARQPAQRIDLDTVSALLTGLERITGERVSITDLLEDADVTERVNPKLTAILKGAKPFDWNEVQGRIPDWTPEERAANDRAAKIIAGGKKAQRKGRGARDRALLEAMGGEESR